MHQLGSPLVLYDNGESMREKILHASARLFALNGFEHVTVRQIARESGVSPRQIYNLYESKLALLHAMLDTCGEMLQTFYSALRGACEQASTFREILDNIFMELIEITNEFSYFALCAAHQMQFVDEWAHRVYCGELLENGVDTLQHVLELGVKKGLCAPFDTHATASLISSSVIVGNDIRAGQLGGCPQTVDLTDWYTAQVNLILHMVQGAACSQQDRVT